jgi:eukaryotic-like serine/threonine-protein kinase
MESDMINRDALLVAGSTMDDCPETCGDASTSATHLFEGDSTLSEAITHRDDARETIAMPTSDEPAATIDEQGQGAVDLGWTLVDDPQQTSSDAGLVRRIASAKKRAELVPGFDILSELGRGGMGVVYRARQHGVDRDVALKMIRGDDHENPEHLGRFKTEAEVLGQLNHPNIVKIYQIGRADDVPFVALELLEGGTLAKRLASTPQPFAESAALLTTLARAVHAAHLAGILHRDLKPSNVLFDGAGAPKIADFGLAKRLEAEDGQTRPDQVLGTPSYMAPEQARGSGPEVGPAADIYSLGAILYEMLTGRPPFKGTTPAETLVMVLNDEPPLIRPGRLRPKLPFDLETICLKCLDRDPRKRYATALDFAEDLDRFLGGQPVLARRTPLWEQGIKLARRRPATSTLAAMCLLAAVLAGSAAWRAQIRASEARIREEDRIVKLKRDAEKVIFEAQTLLAEKQWGVAIAPLSVLASKIERESRLVDVHARVNGLLEQTRTGSRDQRAAEDAKARLIRFRDASDDAHFLDTRFADLGPENRVEATCRAARTALQVFGKEGPNDQWSLPAPPSSLSPSEREEIVSGQYELLMILADAVALSPGDDASARALRILDQVDRLRSPATRAYHLRRAAYLDQAQDAEAAAAERAEAHRLKPADAFDNFLIGRALHRASDWKAAIPYFNAVLQEQPDHFWAQCLLAICHIQLSQPYQARAHLIACLQAKPNSAWLYLLRGFASAGIADIAQKTVPRDPDLAASLTSLAGREFDAAEADYHKALSLLGSGDRPEDCELRYALRVNRGTTRLERNDLGGAAEDLQEAIRLNDRHFDAFSTLALVYNAEGRTEEALAQFTRAIERNPTWPPLYRGRADVLIGQKTMTPAQREAALLDLDEAIRRSPPRSAEVVADETKRAELLHQAGRDDDALKACDVALSAAPKFPAAHRIRIQILLDMKHYDELIRSCDAAIKDDTRSAWLFEMRGLAKESLGNYYGATDDYTQSLIVDADSPKVLCRRGWCYLLKDANRDAAHDFDAAVRLDASNADAYIGRGLARAQLGQHREAASDAAEALKRGDSSSWRLAYNAARVYAQASTVPSLDPARNAPGAVATVLRYQDLAFTYLRRALRLAPAKERAGLLYETMQKDPALQSKPIFRRLRSLDKEVPESRPPV